MLAGEAARRQARLIAVSIVAVACGDDDDSDATVASTTPSTTPGAATTGASTTAAADVDPDGVLRMGVDLSAGGGLRFDPTKMAAGQYIWSTPILRTLLVRQADGTLKPDLAEQASVVDPSTVSVTLRSGLKFSDGTVLDAAAVKATFERNLASANTAGLQINDMALVDTVTADSATKLTIRLKQPSAALVYALLAGVEFAPISPATFAAANAGDGTRVVGAGPMMIQDYVRESSVTMVRNPNYWDADNVTLGGIEYIQTQGGPSMVNALRSGAVDYAVLLTDQAGGLPTEFEVSRHTMTAPNLMQWCIKDGTPLGSTQVRQAVAYSIDREAYNEAIYGGQSEIAWDLWPEDSPWHDSSLDGVYERDIAKAKQLLTEGGYPDGFSFTVLASVLTARDLEVLQAQLREAGIDMQIVQSTNPLDYYIDKKTDATYSQGRPGPLDKISRHFLGNSFSNACKYPSPQAEAIYAQIVALPLEDRRPSTCGTSSRSSSSVSWLGSR